MRKKVLITFLCTVLVLICVWGVVMGINQKETKNILIIGNSHSVDAFHFLYQAFEDCFPDEKIKLGVLYYSGCSISKHVEFGTDDSEVYRYYKNGNGRWKTRENTTMKQVLNDMNWDTVIFQAAKSDLDDTLNETGRRALENLVVELTSGRMDIEFAWHTSWPSPNDEIFFSPDYVKKAPDGYKDNLTALYGFDPVNQFTVLTDMAKEHILTDGTYSKAVCTGVAIMNAYIVQGCPQTEIWRDYTHLSDYGRLIAAYSFAAQFTGCEIENVSIDVIPRKMRHTQYRDLGDMKVTDEMKQVIINASNYSIKDPWSVPSAEN